MIKPFKGRAVDKSKPVYIYRNLHSKEVSYSVRQGGLVVGHTKELGIVRPSFLVNEKGRQRVLREKQKNVHAFIKGWIHPIPHVTKAFKLVYNPYKAGTFMAEECLTGKTEPVEEAACLQITERGIFLRKWPLL